MTFLKFTATALFFIKPALANKTFRILRTDVRWDFFESFDKSIDPSEIETKTVPLTSVTLIIVLEEKEIILITYLIVF